MRKSAVLLLPALLAGCVVVPGGVIPNPNLPATYATATHSPAQSQVFSVVAGGQAAAASVQAGCPGFVAQAPDVSINNQTFAGIIALDIAVTSTGDTTLLVHTPDGAWLCDDDSGPGLNPALHITGPVNGQYDIWVGTLSAGQFPNATLRVY